jgi:Flp pilus assembly protein TadG
VKRTDGGSAVVEFVFLALLMIVPLVYLVAGVAALQRSTLAVSQAARDAGRAFATSDSAAEAQARVAAAVRLALADEGLADDAQVRFVEAGTSCDAASVVPRLAPRAQFTVCVIRRVSLPAIPSVLAGRGIRTIGAYTVHVDDYRAAP